MPLISAEGPTVHPPSLTPARAEHKEEGIVGGWDAQGFWMSPWEGVPNMWVQRSLFEPLTWPRAPGELAETGSFLFSQENRRDLNIGREHHS